MNKRTKRRRISAPKSNRDEFSASVVKLLRERAGNVCGDPGCRRSTLGPQLGGPGVINHGNAAHICAASPNGKRYDATMTPEQRSSADNGIWLCANHASIVDRDEVYYTVELLRAWKREAEAAAAARMGSKVYSDQEVTEEIRSGISGFARRPIIEGIERMHRAQAAALEQLDPRFVVESSFNKGVTEFQFTARDQPVQLSITYAPEIEADIRQKMKALESWGTQFQVDTQHFRITGSPLIETINAFERGALTFGARAIEATARLRVSKQGTLMAVESFRGSATSGRLGVTIEGSAFDGLLSCSFMLPMYPDATEQPTTTLAFDFGPWEGKDIRRLPHITDFIAFLKPLVDGGELACEASIQGIQVLKTSAKDTTLPTFFAAVLGMAQYTEACSVIASYLGIDVRFSTPPDALPKSHVNEVFDSALIAQGLWVGVPNDVRFDMQVLDNAQFVREMLVDPAHWGGSRFIESPRTLSIFGKEVTLPRRALIFENVRLVSQTPPEKIVPGLLLKAGFENKPGAKMRAEYVDGGSGNSTSTMTIGRGEAAESVAAPSKV